MNDLKLIEIGGYGCAGCVALLPQLNAVAAEYGLEFIRIDLESNPRAAAEYAVDRVPAVLLCDGDKIIAKCTGYQPQEIFKLWIEAKIEDYNRRNNNDG